MSNPYPTRGSNFPVVSLICAVILIAVGIAGLIFVPPTSPYFGGVIGLVITTVPLCISAAFTERTNRDIRNGVVTEKARQGAHIALNESGVSDAAALSTPATLTAMQALAKLLEDRQADPLRTVPAPDPGPAAAMKSESVS